MVRYTRKSKRMVGGKRGFQQLVGSRAQVMNGTAYKTTYGRTKSQGGDALTKANLRYKTVKNKRGKVLGRRIVSKAKSTPAAIAKLRKNLRKAGYDFATKGTGFGTNKIGSKKRGRRSRRKRSRRCRHRAGKLKGKFKKCNGRRSRRRRR